MPRPGLQTSSLPNWQESRAMNRKLLNQAAASVDATPALTPVLSELFAGMDSLGSSPRLTVRMLREAGIGRGHRLLDLGCGRGGVTVAAAKAGSRCVGVDAVPSFVAAARELAARRGVAGNCEFRVGDIRRVRSGRTFDAALMLGLFEVTRATALLRKYVRPGGVMIFDDAVVVGAKPARKGWVTLAAARSSIARRGDVIVTEVVWTAAEVRKHETRLYTQLARNAKRLKRTHPELTQELDEFLKRQRTAADELSGILRPVQWSVRVGTEKRPKGNRAS